MKPDCLGSIFQESLAVHPLLNRDPSVSAARRNGIEVFTTQALSLTAASFRT